MYIAYVLAPSLTPWDRIRVRMVGLGMMETMHSSHVIDAVLHVNVSSIAVVSWSMEMLLQWHVEYYYYLTFRFMTL